MWPPQPELKVVLLPAGDGGAQLSSSRGTPCRLIFRLTASPFFTRFAAGLLGMVTKFDD
jgi:hypothetical protein